ncbi:hypothetical protein NZD85_02285 [Empedobacter stercoris]|uniref:Lipoprotein n=2 Tax=Empedobacter TaxID=59734 RepID=A0ABY8V7I2_9FLAO|nr:MULTISPECIES: hypothetical protein [Empedobacter]MCA4808956.1 hypothetical protein [Empedobacter stercoris]MDM1523235.1 hypothetical protein [Empedobacter sp. 225-1]MDM1542191.1 hypothetical protein [Empedobacter sp. 189-2]NOJ74770.1 hypothetical protein [Empedobacter stercoris]QNT14091.1 hypothetical protein HNV03_05160 [Empedobacter stercoris]
MKTTSIILSLVLLTSCYTYTAFDPEEYAAEMAKNANQPTNLKERSRVRAELSQSKRARQDPNQDVNSSTARISKTEMDEFKSNQKTSTEDKIAIDPSTIKITDVIKPDNFYKVDTQGKEYTIEAKQWKADTLYAVVKGTEKELKFHKNDISTFKIRKFSKGKSDALTVASYAIGGAAALLLLK